MATLNFSRILLKLTSKGSIPRDTLHSQDGLNLGDIHFCPIQRTLNMQCISLDYLQKLIAEGAFMPSAAEGTIKLSGMTSLLLVFQADDQHEQITDIYIGLIVCHIDSHLYAPEKILDFVSDIEVDLKVAHDNLEAGCDPGRRCAFCLFVNNYEGMMLVPTDPPYCLIYPMSYVKDVEPDHFDTHNNPARSRLCRYICRATLQYMNDNPCYYRAYGRSHLILPRGTQYKEQLFPKILKPWNHWAPLIDPATKEPFPMKLVGDFRSMDPIFKGCYGDSFLYSDVDLGRLQWQEIHLPPYQGEIPTPPAPSYLQAKQSEATKRSPMRTAMPTVAAESPKTKHSSRKGRHHHSSGHGSNTSTLKCPDSTLAKKPSSSKEQVPKEQDKFPKNHGSCKCGRSPTPPAESNERKWKEVCTEDTCKLNSNLPVSSSGFHGFRSLTGSHSKATELQPPSITLTPLGLGTLQQQLSISEESRCSLASLYISPGFNLPGQLVAGLGNLMPSIPSITGSHQVSSTWPASVLTPSLPSPHLTIDQANSMYKLATECQALGIKLAKKFQVLSSLEAIHRNSIQGTAHEMLTMGCSAREAAYLAVTRDRVPDDEHEATTCHLCLEADVTWKEMHEVMYNHQLQYDGQLATFLTDAEKALNNMCGKVWDAICTLVESESILYDACLGLTLQVLNLLLQIPIDISFHTQIPLIIAYCPESSIYRKWHPKQGGILPLCKEIRASHILSKVLGRVTCQPSESMGRPPSPTLLDHSVGSGGSQGSGHQAHSHAQSTTPMRSQ